MSMQTWEELINGSLSDATAVTATGEQLLVPDFSVPANYMYPGRILRARLSGKISNIVTTPGTLTVRCRWGGLAGTILVASAAMVMNTVAQTDDQWELEMRIACRALGTLMTSGRIIRGNHTTPGLVDLIPASAGAQVTGLTMNAATNLSFTAQFSLTGNSMTCQQYDLESQS